MSNPRRYRKKPVEVEAMQVTVDAAGWPSAVVAAWCGGPATKDAHGALITVNTRVSVDGMLALKGTLYARRGDWVIRDVAGEFSVVKSDVFDATYEPVLPANSEGTGDTR